MNRNVNDTFAKTPTPHFPRSRFDMGIKKRLQTQGHGRLYPFFARAVFPGDTWQMDLTTFVRMDTSVRVPLDDIYLDTYWFFVPYRIIDKDFPKILGEGEPSDYDDVDYGFPSFEVETSDSGTLGIDCLLSYLGYNQSDIYYSEAADKPYSYIHDDDICPYPLMAYYKIFNDWFRDENVDASIPYGDLKGNSLFSIDIIFDDLNALKVNRYHDYFSSAVISPQKGPAVTIPLGTSAPVGVIPSASGTNSNGLNMTIGTGTFTEGKFFDTTRVAGNTTGLTGNPIIADLSQAAGTINELRLAFAIQSLYERRGRFGTRYIETIRGQWGIEVPDSFLERPEYLGGSRVTLNNVPVLSTENSSQLGQMAGNSATLSNGGSWSKTFVEYGIIIGLSCTRVKHSYTQGKRNELFGLKSQLDLYNPVFANIGMQGIKLSSIYNDAGSDDKVFAYQEAWAELRSDFDTFAGLFGMISNNSDLKNYWHYGDYYSSEPQFSADWLKEPVSNVSRTLTGQLINGANSESGHQFMFGYYYHPVVTRILPAHSIPVELIGRL